MNDIDDLRAALRQPPAEPFAEPDLARIMADGARIRRRRRMLSGAGIAAAAAVVVTVVVFAVQLRQPAPVAQPATPQLSTVAPTTSAEPVRQPLGDVVDTGLRTSRGDELVIYAVAISDTAIPNIHFGLMISSRGGTGSLQELLTTNETSTKGDRTFGFHAADGGEEVGGSLLPVFGYFAGPAERVTTTVHGKTFDASVRRWTEDPDVVIFWFDPRDVPSNQVLTPLVAYDATGNIIAK